jgi:hypothetical protein
MVKSLFAIALLPCALVSAQGWAQTWNSRLNVRPDGFNVYAACQECNEREECVEWCEDTEGCLSVSWSENWRTCEGYNEVEYVHFVESIAPNSYYMFKGDPSPSPVPKVVSFGKEKAWVPNHPPTLAASINTQEGQVGQPFQLQIDGHFIDADSDPLTYAAKGLPSGLKLQGSAVTGIPKRDGRFKVSLTATDGKAYPASMPPFWLVIKSEDGRLPPMITDEEYAVLEAKREAHQGPDGKKKGSAKGTGKSGKSKGTTKKGKGGGKIRLVKKVSSHVAQLLQEEAAAPAAAPAMVKTGNVKKLGKKQGVRKLEDVSVTTHDASNATVTF